MSQSKSLWVNQNGFKFGTSRFGTHGAETGSVKQIVHDGDTVNVMLFKNLGVRFLGIDTPEISFEFPGTNSFVSSKDPRWKDYFTSGQWKENLEIPEELMTYLERKIGDGTDVHTNHYTLADEAQKSLEDMLQNDLTLSGKKKEEFLFFLAFGNEFLDGYGRLLCYIHPDNENFSTEPPSKESYNERQLAAGYGVPYFIWPNIQPFLSIKPFAEENVKPDKFWETVNKSTKLQNAREAFKSARNRKIGVYQTDKELKLSAFELRFVSRIRNGRKTGPDRYIIDLSSPGLNSLYPPADYHLIPNPEDRLFIPKEYIPIFKMFGWK
jgi:endonuclease YncB( thermonuclease family)